VNHVSRVDVINGALEIVLGSGEIILCSAPSGFVSAGFGTWPILRR
jgi:hypothetical protein